MSYEQHYDNEEEKFNAGLDAQKRVMELYKRIDEASLTTEGEYQKHKYQLLGVLCLAVRGMFRKDELRNEIWSKYKDINLEYKQVTIRQGKSTTKVLYSRKVDDKMNELIMFITDQLQDTRDFFTPRGDEPGL